MDFKQVPSGAFDSMTLQLDYESLISHVSSLPLWQQVVGGGAIALVLAVVLNVLAQVLLPRDRSLPPVVFDCRDIVDKPRVSRILAFEPF